MACETCRGMKKKIMFRPGQREFGGDASTSYEIPCPDCVKEDQCEALDRHSKPVMGQPISSIKWSKSISTKKCPTCMQPVGKPYREYLNIRGGKHGDGATLSGCVDQCHGATLSGCVDQCHGPYLEPESREHRWHNHPRAEAIRQRVLSGVPVFRSDPGMKHCKCRKLVRIGGLGFNRNSKESVPDPKCKVCKGSGWNTKF